MSTKDRPREGGPNPAALRTMIELLYEAGQAKIEDGDVTRWGAICDEPDLAVLAHDICFARAGMDDRHRLLIGEGLLAAAASAPGRASAHPRWIEIRSRYALNQGSLWREMSRIRDAADQVAEVSARAPAPIIIDTLLYDRVRVATAVRLRDLHPDCTDAERRVRAAGIEKLRDWARAHLDPDITAAWRTEEENKEVARLTRNAKAREVRALKSPARHAKRASLRAATASAHEKRVAGLRDGSIRPDPLPFAQDAKGRARIPASCDSAPPLWTPVTWGPHRAGEAVDPAVVAVARFLTRMGMPPVRVAATLGFATGSSQLRRAIQGRTGRGRVTIYRNILQPPPGQDPDHIDQPPWLRPTPEQRRWWAQIGDGQPALVAAVARLNGTLGTELEVECWPGAYAATPGGHPGWRLIDRRSRDQILAVRPTARRLMFHLNRLNHASRRGRLGRLPIPSRRGTIETDALDPGLWGRDLPPVHVPPPEWSNFADHLVTLLETLPPEEVDGLTAT